MSKSNYNRGRYYTRSQHLSDQRDDINTILRLKSEVASLKAEIERLNAELKEARGED